MKLINALYEENKTFLLLQNMVQTNVTGI